MTKKKTKEFTRSIESAVEKLTRLAEDLKTHRLPMGDSDMPIRGPLLFKSKTTLKGSRLEYEIVIETTADLAESKDKSFIKASSVKSSRPPVKKRIPPLHPGEKTPMNSKKLKKDISRLWKDVSRRIKDHAAADKSQAESLLDKCEEYRLLTHKEYAEEWSACVEVIRQCLAESDSGKFDEAVNLIAQVNRLTRECHKKHK